jgi:hypothetical protein
LRGVTHCEKLALRRHAGRCIRKRRGVRVQCATRPPRFDGYLVYADAQLVYALSVEATHDSCPAPPRLVWSVQHVDALFTRPVDLLSACLVPVYAVSSTCAAEHRSCRYRRDRAASVGCRRYCVRALLSPETSMLNGVRCWYYHPGRCYSIISLPPLTP